MQITNALEITQNPRAVFAALCDPQYVAYRCERAGLNLSTNEVVTTPEGAVTAVARLAMASDVVPANFRSFVGAELDIHQTTAWAEPELSDPAGTGKRVGTFALEIHGAPVRISGTLILDAAANGSGSILTYSGEIVASVPLFGAMIEKAIAGVVTSMLAQEAQYVSEWIAERG